VKGFIDIHTHILPGVDDGAQQLSDALALLDIAWQNGTRALVLTPHYRGKYKANTPQALLHAFGTLQKAAREKLPGLELFLGHEVYWETAAPEALSAGKILRMNDSHYILLEFRPSSLRSQVVQGVSEVILSGFTPIIAHAERYEIFLKDKTLADELLNMGALIQLNADSILGEQGFSVKRCCHRLLKERKAHFVASDAHDDAHRPPVLRECFLHVHKKYGAEYAVQLFSENALAVINNNTI